MFAKSERVQSLMQRTWSETVRRRTYVAVVEGAFDKKSGTVSTYLAESKGYKVFVTKDRSAGERAVTRYRVLRFRDGFSLVELELETGKKNQIRAHMEYIGHPVAGDRKYGAHGRSGGSGGAACEQALFRASGDGARARFFVARSGRFRADREVKRFPDRVYEERRVAPDCGIFENRSGRMKKTERFFGLFEIMSTFAPNSCCIRLTVRTVDSQSTNTGSIPVCSTTSRRKTRRLFRLSPGRTRRPVCHGKRKLR